MKAERSHIHIRPEETDARHGELMYILMGHHRPERALKWNRTLYEAFFLSKESIRFRKIVEYKPLH